MTMRWKVALIVLTIINVIVLILNVIGFIGTKKNLQLFNQTDDAFEYKESEKGRVELALHKGQRVTIIFNETNAEVVGAYQYERPDVVRIIRFIRYYCELNDVEVKRTNSDLWGEYRLHTALYKVGYKRSQTGDANLDYESDKRWYVNALGSVIGWLGF